MVIASKSRRWEIVEILVNLKACVNIPTSSEWRPVHAAIEDENMIRLRYFMDNGVDIFDQQKFTDDEEVR